ncbi:MAG: hypothetical protein FWG99_08865 [Treponema sp.]|nr:hypothetical protein [Treponema sp.]
MRKKKAAIKIILLCILAAAANNGLNILCIDIIKIPLFLDTVFTAAVSFTVGLVPGLITALLTQAGSSFREGSTNPFVLCSFAEVLLICALNPLAAKKKPLNGEQSGDLKRSRPQTSATVVSIFARLLLLYIVSCLAISILGGIIDFVYHGLFSMSKPYFSAEDSFKISLMRGGTPMLVINILSRIPVNIVDRFVVIFGGFFLSRGLRKIFSAS